MSNTQCRQLFAMLTAANMKIDFNINELTIEELKTLVKFVKRNLKDRTIYKNKIETIRKNELTYDTYFETKIEKTIEPINSVLNTLGYHLQYNDLKYHIVNINTNKGIIGKIKTNYRSARKTWYSSIEFNGLDDIRFYLKNSSTGERELNLKNLDLNFYIVFSNNTMLELFLQVNPQEKVNWVSLKSHDVRDAQKKHNNHVDINILPNRISAFEYNDKGMCGKHLFYRTEKIYNHLYYVGDGESKINIYQDYDNKEEFYFVTPNGEKTVLNPKEAEDKANQLIQSNVSEIALNSVIDCGQQYVPQFQESIVALSKTIAKSNPELAGCLSSQVLEKYLENRLENQEICNTKSTRFLK